jgi:hypothetical protein
MAIVRKITFAGLITDLKDIDDVLGHVGISLGSGQEEQARFLTKQRQGQGQGKRQQDGLYIRNRNCMWCGRHSHWKRECKQRHKEQTPKGKEAEEKFRKREKGKMVKVVDEPEERASVVSSVDTIDMDFVVDCGAFPSILPPDPQITDVRDVKIQASQADGSGLPIKGKGKAKLFKGVETEVSISNSVEEPLLSVLQSCRQHKMSVVLDWESVRFADGKVGVSRLLGEGDIQGNSYHFNPNMGNPKA